VNPGIANVTYARPYLVSLNDSIASGKLTLLNPSAGDPGNSITNIGDLSPAAGGNYQDDVLGSLSPSAGGSLAAGGPSGVNCANAYLDHKWLDDPALRQCTEHGQVAGIFAGLAPAAGGNPAPAAGSMTTCVKYAVRKVHHLHGHSHLHRALKAAKGPVAQPCLEYATIPTTTAAAATPATPAAVAPTTLAPAR
jgi:hypothetical protein